MYVLSMERVVLPKSGDLRGSLFSFQRLKWLIFKQEKYHFNTKKVRAVIKEQYKKLGKVR